MTVSTKHSLGVVLFALLDLMRLRIVGMVLVSCVIGFVIAYRGPCYLDKMLWALLGTGLVSGGACALNCYIERDHDSQMLRTCRRPLPAGIVSPATALLFGVSIIVAGCYLLAAKVNALCSVLGSTAAFVYLVLYTPAKRCMWTNTSIGAIPGAIPPLIGWAAARGQIDPNGWVLFAMLFVWQHTHFFPIAWLYRDDYRKAGFHMLPVLESDGEMTFRLTVITAIILLPISMLLCGSPFVGYAYGLTSFVFGMVLIVSSYRWLREPTRKGARTVLFLSLAYLPLILVAVLLDRYAFDLADRVVGCLVHVWQWT